MDGIWMPKVLERNWVITPLRPSSRIHEYAPMKLGLIMEMMMRISMTPLPRILKKDMM